MRILVVTTKCPFPLNEGRALRTYNLLREAAKRHEIVLCTYVQSESEVAGLAEMRKFCAEVHAVELYLGSYWPQLARDVLIDAVSPEPIMAIKYRTAAMSQLVRRMMAGRQIDVVHLDMLHLAELMHVVGGVPVVLVEHNVETVLLERRASEESNVLKRIYLRRQVAKLRKYESTACRIAQRVVTVSEADSTLLQQMADGCRTTSVPNAVDTAYFRPELGSIEPHSMVYVGGMGWYPNLDAIDFFVSAILPRIRAVNPGAHLTVIGHIPNERAVDRWRAMEGISFAGMVDDIRPIVSRAAVFIVPLRIGGGTRLKILDAMAMGKAIVSTSIGCEGLDVVNGEHMVVADTPECFADEVSRVLDDAGLASRLSLSARRRVEERYRWEAVALGMEDAYRDAVAPSSVTTDSV